MSPSKILSLTIGPKSLFLAELVAKGTGGRPAITHLAEFSFPADLSLSTPVELGQALASFLRQQKFSARDLYIGLPARRLVTRRKDVPPASASVASSTLRLQAETEFSSATGGSGEADSFIVDFAGQTSSSDPSSVLLVATAQSCIEQCRQLATAANLRLRGITASSAALARATAALSSQPLAECLILTITSGAAEIVVTHGSAPTQLRHLAVANAGAPESVSALAGEIRRTVASLHRNGSAGTPLTLALWDDSTQDTNILSERIGMPITTPELQSLAQNQAQGAASPGNQNAFAPAVAVGLAALSRPGIPVDFLHSRLAPPKEPSKNRPVVIGVTVAAVAVLLVILGVVDIYLKQSHLENLQTQSTTHSPEVKIAQAASDRLDEANAWIHRPAQFVPCLRDLTILVPDVGESIWATSLSITADPKSSNQLVGQSVDLQGVKDLTHKMLDSKQFQIKNVTYPGNRTNTGATEITFSIEFNYTPAEHKK